MTMDRSQTKAINLASVLEFCKTQKSAAQIAKHLGVTQRTTREYISILRSKNKIIAIPVLADGRKLLWKTVKQ